MKGTNKFTFNQATMREAIHYWMKDTLLKNGDDFEVDSIEALGGSPIDEFLIVISEIPEEPEQE